MDVFLMVRRKKTTIFLDAKENTTVLEVYIVVKARHVGFAVLQCSLKSYFQATFDIPTPSQIYLIGKKYHFSLYIILK